jgi:hypothetical protein
MRPKPKSPNPYQNLVLADIGFGPFTCAVSFSAIKILLKKIKKLRLYRNSGEPILTAVSLPQNTNRRKKPRRYNEEKTTMNTKAHKGKKDNDTRTRKPRQARPETAVDCAL